MAQDPTQTDQPNNPAEPESRKSASELTIIVLPTIIPSRPYPPAFFIPFPAYIIDVPEYLVPRYPSHYVFTRLP